MIEWFIMIWNQMIFYGNFSFLILIVGIAQLIVMSIKKKNEKDKETKE